MVDHKYNELDYGKEIYENGFQSLFIRYELVVLVKYLKYNKYSKKDTESFLYDFCEKYIEGFNKVKYYKVIDGAIRDGRKRNNPLIIIKDIPIYIKELEYLDSLDIENEYKKLLLSFYVKKKIALEIHSLINPYAEISVYFEGSKKKFKEIFTSSNIQSKYKIEYMIHELVKKKIVTSTCNGDIILDYIKELLNNNSNGEIFCYLKAGDFDKVGLVFDSYKQINKVIICEVCNKIVKSKGKRNNKYCETCAKEKIKERDRLRKRLKI